MAARLGCNHTLVSSVIPFSQSERKKILAVPGLRFLTSATELPIRNLYLTPKTLGTDRLANAVAGNFLFPRKNVLVIDVGTCIKYDFVNARAEYLGGSISPGLSMRFRAMHEFTGKLPMVSEERPKVLTGRSTSEAMQTGVFAGVEEEIRGVISRYKKKYVQLAVVITGGDSRRFVRELNLSIFAAPDLVNLGLNEITRFNYPGE